MVHNSTPLGDRRHATIVLPPTIFPHLILQLIVLLHKITSVWWSTVCRLCVFESKSDDGGARSLGMDIIIVITIIIKIIIKMASHILCTFTRLAKPKSEKVH